MVAPSRPSASASDAVSTWPSARMPETVSVPGSLTLAMAAVGAETGDSSTPPGSVKKAWTRTYWPTSACVSVKVSAWARLPAMSVQGPVGLAATCHW